MSEKDQKKPCVMCGEQIAQRAVLCSTCGSLQDWRRHFKVSETVLALIVAFLAILTVLIQASASIWPSRPSDLELSSPVFYGTSAYVVVANSGDQNGIIQDGFLTSEFFSGQIKFDPILPESRIVQPGMHQIAFHPDREATSEEASKLVQAIAQANRAIDGGERAGTLAFAIRDSNGKLNEVIVDVSHYELLKFFNCQVIECRPAGENRAAKEPKNPVRSIGP